MDSFAGEIYIFYYDIDSKNYITHYVCKYMNTIKKKNFKVKMVYVPYRTYAGNYTMFYKGNKKLFLGYLQFYFIYISKTN